MKRGTLVDYESSDDEKSSIEFPVAPPPKKRRLPSLASSLVSTARKDNPALHQGRIRTNPHVEGQYAAYVYVPVKLVPSGSLHSLLCKVVTRARDIVPILQAIGVSVDPQDSPQDADAERELHVSLTRPTYLRAHQREGFKAALRTIAKAYPPFQASFATFAELSNDERTRAFLTAEIGAGHTELKALCDSVTPVLRTFRQKEFYSEPRFHASIAWALLQRASRIHDAETDAASGQNVVDQIPTSSTLIVVKGKEVVKEAQDHNRKPEFPSIPHFPPELVSTLETEFGAVLRTRNIGTFECEYLCVRIGRDTTQWKLSS
ncbi:hypothetical protein BC835DRAFT_1407881 [Cytidiella melzeri]|nr:hypothetical protein BC835DRAFT_1407881 [Cytidiella melzeri]